MVIEGALDNAVYGSTFVAGAVACADWRADVYFLHLPQPLALPPPIIYRFVAYPVLFQKISKIIQ